MAQKAGYTKSGKSIKSVKRYYAQLNAGKTPAPKDDKLSNRIAMELQTTKDANEKRGSPIENPPQTQPEASQTNPKSAKSTKSMGPSIVSRDVLDNGRNSQAFGYWEVYIVVLCLFCSLNFLIAYITNGIFWKVRDHTNVDDKNAINPIVQTYELTVGFGWAALTVTITLCVWLKLRSKILINAICLVGMATGLVLIIVFLVSYAMVRKNIRAEFYWLQWHDHIITFFGLSYAVLIAFVMKMMVQQILFIRKSSAGGGRANKSSAPGGISALMA